MGTARLRSVARRALLMLLGLSVALGAVEVVLRAREGNLFSSYPSRWVHHPVYGWALNRNVDVHVRTDEFEVYDHQNSRGLVGPEVELRKEPGTFRILVLGDSMTDAFQVDRTDRFVTRLGALARRDGWQVEVLNTAVSSFSTDQEVLLFENEGRLFEPDLVLIAFALSNDAMSNTRESRVTGEPVYKPLFRLRDGRLIDPAPVPDLMGMQFNAIPIRGVTPFDLAVNSVKRWLYLNFATYRALSDTWFRLRAPREPALSAEWLVYGPQTDDRVVRAWEMTAALLARLKEDVRASGARLGLVMIPDDFQVYPELWRKVLETYRLPPPEWDPEAPDREMQRICARLEIPCLDPLPALRAAGDGLYFPRDRHFTARGNAVVADEIYDWLRRSDMIR